MLKRLGLLTTLLCVLALLTGCDETTQEITLNPDGSGKMVYTIRHPLQGFGSRSTASPEEQAKEYVGGLIRHSTGIDAWKEVSFRLSDDRQAVHLTGTIYFRNLAQVTFTSNPNIRIGGQRTWKVQPRDGRLVLELGEAAAPEGQETVAPPKLSEAEVRQQAEAAQKQFQRQFAAMSEFLQELRETYILHLPATPADKTIFHAGEAPRSVQLVYDGKEMVKAIHTLTADLEWWKKQLRAGKGPSDPGSLPELNKLLFGTEAIARVMVEGPMQPQFPYAQEVVAAQQQMEAMVTRLGLGESALPPASGEGFMSLRVGGMRYVHEADFDARIIPFNHHQLGCSMALIGVFSGSVLEVESVDLTEAEATDGTVLLPPARNARFINKTLSKDNQTLVFELPLQLPPPGITGLRTIAGTVTYSVADGTDVIDLGTHGTTAGPFGDRFGLTVDVKENARQQGNQELSLKFAEALPGKVKEVRLYTADGVRLDAQQTSRMSFNNRLELRYTFVGDRPERLRIELVLHANIRSYKIPFRMEHIDLAGRPLK